MANNTYKLNLPVKVVYQALGGTSGIIDLTMKVYNPSGTLFQTSTLTEDIGAIYKGTFTPDALGRWWVKIYSVLYPENSVEESYYVAENEETSTVSVSGNVLTTIQDPVNPNYKAGVDSQNRLKVTMTPTLKTTIDLFYENASIANYVVNMWRSMLKYTVPAGYQYELINFTSLCGSIAGSSRVVALQKFGTYNVNTNTFVAEDTCPSPGFASTVEAEVITQFNSQTTTLTVTYTNQDGVANRTGTINIAVSAPIGYRYQMTLQNSDFGIQAITNVTDNRTQVGAVQLYGIRSLFYNRNEVSDNAYLNTTSRESIILEAGTIISLELSGTNITNTRRLLKALGLLIPE